MTFGVAGVATSGQLFAGTRPAQAASGGAGAAVAHGPVKAGLREGAFEAAHALAWRGPVTDLPVSGRNKKELYLLRDAFEELRDFDDAQGCWAFDVPVDNASPEYGYLKPRWRRMRAILHPVHG